MPQDERGTNSGRTRDERRTSAGRTRGNHAARRALYLSREFCGLPQTTQHGAAILVVALLGKRLLQIEDELGVVIVPVRAAGNFRRKTVRAKSFARTPLTDQINDIVELG